MVNRTQIIQWTIDTKKFTSYLEVGVWRGKNFDAINVDHKVSVDPCGHPTFKMTSDAFFSINKAKFDLIFIDGLHHSEQVHRDVLNSLDFLTPSGIILMHDCLPQCEEAQFRDRIPRVKGGWTGDCWKAFAYLRATRGDLVMLTIERDHGIGVISKGGHQICYGGKYDSYQDFVENKKQMMNTCGFRVASKIIKQLL